MVLGLSSQRRWAKESVAAALLILAATILFAACSPGSKDEPPAGEPESVVDTSAPEAMDQAEPAPIPVELGTDFVLQEGHPVVISSLATKISVRFRSTSVSRYIEIFATPARGGAEKFVSMGRGNAGVFEVRGMPYVIRVWSSTGPRSEPGWLSARRPSRCTRTDWRNLGAASRLHVEDQEQHDHPQGARSDQAPRHGQHGR